jgi:7-keto-8-aminopelargonate synthetase-like enzyme
VQRIRRCGGPMLFSGPIQPPMLGAGVGSARLHLSPGFAALQAELQERLAVGLATIERVGLELTTPACSPIFQAQCDSPRVAFAVAERMRERGFYCCICVFPAVPMNRPGIRFTITRHNEPDDVKAFVTALAASVHEVAQSIRKSAPELVSFGE